MTDDELVEFTELPVAELPAAPARGARRGGRSGSRKSSTTRTRSTTRTAAQPPPVAVSA